MVVAEVKRGPEDFSGFTQLTWFDNSPVIFLQTLFNLHKDSKQAHHNVFQPQLTFYLKNQAEVYNLNTTTKLLHQMVIFAIYPPKINKVMKHAIFHFKLNNRNNFPLPKPIKNPVFYSRDDIE